MQVTPEIEITNEDNIKLMARYEDNHFDLAIVDPPYGRNILKKNKFQAHDSKGTTYSNTSIPDKSYFDELARVSKRFIVFGMKYMYHMLPPDGSMIIWDKGADADLHNMDACDVAFYSKPSRMRKFYLHWCGAVKCEQEKTIHIHQKPVRIYEAILRKYAKNGDRILDTHLGSGSIAIALDRMNKIEQMNLTLTACELDKDYYESAIKRIKQNTNQIAIPL
ncbi:MAG: DNA methyltransferase [Bacteroidota bacterium]